MCAAANNRRLSSRQETSRKPQIPVFSLYGEADAIPPEFIHIEDIRSRSERYEWKIAEHRHNGLFQLLLLIEGGAQLRIEHGLEDVRAPFAVAIPSGIAHAFRFAPETRGFVLTIEEVMLARRSARVGGPQALLAGCGTIATPGCSGSHRRRSASPPPTCRRLGIHAGI